MPDYFPWYQKSALCERLVKPVSVQSVTYTWQIRDKSLLEKTRPTEGYNPWRMETKFALKTLVFAEIRDGLSINQSINQ